MQRCDRNPGAAAEVKRLFADGVRLSEPRQHLADDLGDEQRRAAIGKDDDEFVAAEPAGQRIGRAARHR